MPPIAAANNGCSRNGWYHGSRVTLEAMASGIPVISTAAGGPIDIIQSGVDGILVPPRNAKALADAIVSLAPQREPLVQAARKRVGDFGIRNVVPQIEAFYRTL